MHGNNIQVKLYGDTCMCVTMNHIVVMGYGL